MNGDGVDEYERQLWADADADYFERAYRYFGEKAREPGWYPAKARKPSWRYRLFLWLRQP